VESKTINFKMHDTAKRDAGTAGSAKATQVVDRARHTTREITVTVARSREDGAQGDQWLRETTNRVAHRVERSVKH
jgi:hypothetical protein